MEVTMLREAPAPREPDSEEEHRPAGSEPGDPRAKPPVKPKPRALPAKPALPTKPSLLVPVGPRPPRGPLAELPSARKMNMLAGPQPYGGNKRPLPFVPRPAAEAAAAEAAQEPGKEELPPLAPPARCAAPGGVRKAPAPFRLASERCAATTVEEILAKIEHPKKDPPPSPDRLWGSRLSFNQDGSSGYGSRAALTRGWSQEGAMEALAPASSPEGQSKTPKASEPSPDLAINGDLAQPATPEPLAHVPPGLGHPADVSGPAPRPAQLPLLPEISAQHTELPEASSPSASEALPHPPVTPPSPAVTLPPVDKDLCHPPSLGASRKAAPEAPRPSSPLLEPVSGHPGPGPAPVTSPLPLVQGMEEPDLTRTLPPREEVAPSGDPDPCPTSLAQRRFSEGVLRPPIQDQEKLGGSLAALPQARGSQLALDCPFGSGAESNWSLSQSFEWTFPTRPAGLGVRRRGSPPPSPITEASEATEDGHCARSPPGDAERPVSWVQAEDPGGSPPPGPLLQAEERAEDWAPPPREGPLPPDPREAALSLLEPVLGQQHPAPPDQPCVLFAGGPSPGQALSGEQEAMTLARAETAQPGTEAQDWYPESPQPEGPGGSARWLDELLASPPLPKDAALPSAQAEGLLGWAQKDLQSEFGIAADPHPGSPGPSGWSHVASRDCGHGGASPRGALGPGDRDWARDGGGREWVEVGSHALRDPCDPEQLVAHSDWVARQPALLGTQGWEATAQDQEPRKRDSRDSFSSLQAELQDQEFGKRTSRDTFSSRDVEGRDQGLGKRDSRDSFSRLQAELQDQEFGKRDSWDTFSSLQAELQDQDLGKRDSWNTFSSVQAELQDQELGKRDSRDLFCSVQAELQDQELGKRDSQDSFSRLQAELQDQEFGKRDSRDSFSSLQDQELGKRDSWNTFSSVQAELQDQELGKRDSRDSFSRLQAELQDQEFGKRDSRDSFSSLQDQELGKRDSRDSFSSVQAELQDQELGKRDSRDSFPGLHVGFQGQEPRERDSLGLHMSLESSLQDWEFGAGDHQPEEKPARGAGSEEPCSYGSHDAEVQDQESEKRGSVPSALRSTAEVLRAQALQQSPWVQDHGDSHSEQEGSLGPRPPGSGLGPQLAQQQLQESEMAQGCGASGPPQELQSGWQGRDAGWEAAGPLGPGDIGLEDGDPGKRGWSGELSLGVTPQPEAAFSPGPGDWTEDLGLGPGLRSVQFGIIGDDRAGGASPSSPGTARGGHFVSPMETVAGPGDWADQLGLRNLDVSCCGDLAEAREIAPGQGAWLDGLGTHNGAPASCSDSGGSGAVGAGEDWTVEIGVPSTDEKTGGPGQARDRGVGQTDWFGVEASEFLRSRQRGVGQADWSPGLGLGNTIPAEPRELGVRLESWGDDLGLRNLEGPCAPELGAARGSGVGHMDWAPDGGPMAEGLSAAPGEARERGVGEAGPTLERGVGSPGSSSPSLEARVSGAGWTSGPEIRGADGCCPSSEAHPEDPGAETGEATGFGASPGQCPVRSPPPGAQGLLEGMLVTSSAQAEAARELVASGLSVLLEREGAAAGGDPLPARRPQPDGAASCAEQVDGTWGLAGPGHGEQDPALIPRRPPPGPPGPSQDFSFIQDTEVLDSAMYRSRAHLGRKRGHRAPAIRPGGTLGLAEAADSDVRLFQDSTELRAARLPSSDEEVVEEPQSRRTRMSLGAKGLKASLFPGLSPSALKAKLRSRNRSAEEVEPAEGKAGQKEAGVQRSKSCKVPGLGKPLTLPPKPEKSSGSEASSPSWLQALKLRKKKV